MNTSSIEWCDSTWNVIRGCEAVSPGCAHCYAAEIATRFTGEGLAFEGLGRRLGNGHAAWTGARRFEPSKLLGPLRQAAGQRIFVNSVSDLWWDQVPDSLIAAHLAVAYLTPHHRFLCLTKRSERLAGWLSRWGGADPVASAGWALAAWLTGGEEGGPDVAAVGERIQEALNASPHRNVWPPPNWLQGVSVEDQPRASRVEDLLHAGFACPWVSAEPLLGPLSLTRQLLSSDPVEGECDACGGSGERLVCIDDLCRGAGECMHGDGWAECSACGGEGGWEEDFRPGLRWIVIGGESGRHARPCQREWIQDLVRDCGLAGVPAFVKQLGARYEDPLNGVGGARVTVDETMVGRIRRLHSKKGGDPSEWPTFLRVREYPPEAIPDAEGPRYRGPWPLSRGGANG